VGVGRDCDFGRPAGFGGARARPPIGARAATVGWLEQLGSASIAVLCELVDGQFIVSFSDLEPCPAIALLPGSPPWLSLEDVPKTPDVQTETVSADEPAGSGTHPIVNYRQDKWLLAEVERLREALTGAEETIWHLRKQLRNSGKFAAPVVYTDVEEQFRFEIQVSYLSRVDEINRSRNPLPDRFVLGPDFLPRVRDLVEAGGIGRQKIVDVCADVLCGRAWQLRSTGVKESTTPSRGPQLARPRDGAMAMRGRLREGTTPGAYDIGNCHPVEIELDRVTVHDYGT
jgi:hypothetical protein